MQPIVFRLAKAAALALGVRPSWQGAIPPPASYLRITGVTRDASGVALGNCVMQVFRSVDDVLVIESASDASGNYDVRVPSLEQHYIVAYKAGSPDVAGTTVNTLQGGA